GLHGMPPMRLHSDFCLGFSAAPLAWLGRLSQALVLGLPSGFLVWGGCCRKVKFTTPIQEAGRKCLPERAIIQGQSLAPANRRPHPFIIHSFIHLEPAPAPQSAPETAPR
uniref:Uncharacterized protein n=2 Tax=Ursus TaxID=9639 RepID=A0A452U8M3_URSMA